MILKWEDLTSQFQLRIKKESFANPIQYAERKENQDGHTPDPSIKPWSHTVVKQWHKPGNKWVQWNLLKLSLKRPRRKKTPRVYKLPSCLVSRPWDGTTALEWMHSSVTQKTKWHSLNKPSREGTMKTRITSAAILKLHRGDQGSHIRQILTSPCVYETDLPPPDHNPSFGCQTSVILKEWRFPSISVVSNQWAVSRSPWLNTTCPACVNQGI